MVLTNWELALAFATWATVFYFAGRQYMKDRVKRLTKANSSLITDIKNGLIITVSQHDEYNRIVGEHKVLNEQQNEVVAYIRDNYPQMLTGHPSFSALVVAVLKGKQ